MSNNFGIGVVGLGIGQSILSQILKENTSDHFYIYDIDRKKSQNLSSKFSNVFISKNFEEILKNKKIKVVYIASYDKDHKEQILKCFENNKHILVEKPAVNLLSDLEIVREYHNLNPSILLEMNMVLRECPLIKQITKLINDNYFGEIYSVDLSYYWGRTWKFDEWRSLDDNYNIITGAGIHLIDLLYDWHELDLEILEVTKSDISRKIGKSPSTVKISSRSRKNGGLISFNIFGPSSHPHHHQISILGSDASFQLNSSQALMYKKLNSKKNEKNDFDLPIDNISRIVDYKNSFNKIVFELNSCYPRKDTRHLLFKNFIESIKLEKINTKRMLRLFKVMDYCFECIDRLR